MPSSAEEHTTPQNITRPRGSAWRLQKFVFAKIIILYDALLAHMIPSTHGAGCAVAANVAALLC